MFESSMSLNSTDFPSIVLCYTFKLPLDEHEKTNLKDLKNRELQLQKDTQIYIQENIDYILEELVQLNIIPSINSNLSKTIADYSKTETRLIRVKFVLKEIIVYLLSKEVKGDRGINFGRNHLEEFFEAH